MQEQLQERLKEEFNLDEGQIAAILALGIHEESDMALLQETDLTGIAPIIVARKILAAFKPAQSVVVSEPPPSAAPAVSGPTQVIVQMDKPVSEMTVPDLLQALESDQTDEDVYDELVTRDAYTIAATKTEDVAVPAEGGGLHAAQTAKYWQFLRKGAPQRTWQGQRTVTLEKALGRVEKLLYHPLFTNSTIYMGLDEYGRDWSGVDRTRMAAAYWARTTGHSLFPKDPDPLDVYAELAATELKERWVSIVTDYEEYVEDSGAPISLVVTAERRIVNGGDRPVRRNSFDL